LIDVTNASSFIGNGVSEISNSFTSVSCRTRTPWLPPKALLDLARSRGVTQPDHFLAALRMGDAGAQILDVRDAAEYAKGHLAGSINIGLGGQYATWAGTVLDRAKPIVIIAEPGREKEAALRLDILGQ
jgi:Rhodanese-like domain